MIMLDLKLDSCNAQKVSFKRERKSFTLLLYMKSMLSIAELKVSWHCLLEILVKLSQRLENKLIRKLLNGEKREELRLFQVYSLSMRSICLILSVSHF